MKNVDFLDLRILEGVGAEGPRNLASVARKLGIKKSTLYSRLRRLKPLIFLSVNVYHTFVGLRKCCVLAKAVQGKENLLFECMKAHDYWLYVFRCYGEIEGCFGVYATPPEHQAEFEAFINALELSGVAQSTELFWSTCFHTVNPTTRWFDEETDRWVFPWNDWIAEVGRETTDLPYTLKDPDGFPQKADYTDIFILKELEVDATKSLQSIARRLETTLQNVKYHYDKHVVRRRLIEGFQVVSFPYDREKSDFFVLILTFPNESALAKLAQSLFDKPFARTIGKVHGKASLVVQVNLPRAEFRRFTDALSKLINLGQLTSYKSLIQDLRHLSRETIPYKLFVDGHWTYDHEKYMKELRQLQEKEEAPQKASPAVC